MWGWRCGEALSDMHYEHFISLLLVLFNYAVINFVAQPHA